jgi:hypothetical protein
VLLRDSMWLLWLCGVEGGKSWGVAVGKKERIPITSHNTRPRSHCLGGIATADVDCNPNVKRHR